MNISLTRHARQYGHVKPDAERHAFLDECYRAGEWFWCVPVLCYPPIPSHAA